METQQHFWLLMTYYLIKRPVLLLILFRIIVIMHHHQESPEHPSVFVKILSSAPQHHLTCTETSVSFWVDFPFK